MRIVDLVMIRAVDSIVLELFMLMFDKSQNGGDVAAQDLGEVISDVPTESFNRCAVSCSVHTAVHGGFFANVTKFQCR